MITEDGKRSWTHGQPAEVLQKQSRAIGIPLIQRQTTMEDYETKFKDVLLSLKQKGMKGGVFGAIDIEEHKQWIDGICQQTDITPYLPLWGQAQEMVLKEFIGSGFEAIIVVAKSDLFGEEWLGRKVDPDFLAYLSELKQRNEIQLCGEAGEYHTLVIDGPIFNQRIEILETNKVLKEGRWLLEISKCALRSKRG